MATISFFFCCRRHRRATLPLSKPQPLYRPWNQTSKKGITLVFGQNLLISSVVNHRQNNRKKEKMCTMKENGEREEEKDTATKIITT